LTWSFSSKMSIGFSSMSSIKFSSSSPSYSSPSLSSSLNSWSSLSWLLLVLNESFFKLDPFSWLVSCCLTLFFFKEYWQPIFFKVKKVSLSLLEGCQSGLCSSNRLKDHHLEENPSFLIYVNVNKILKAFLNSYIKSKTKSDLL